MGAMGKPFDIFLSHAGMQKRILVDNVHRGIKLAIPDARIFLDQHSLKYGSDAPEAMREALGESAVGELPVHEMVCSRLATQITNTVGGCYVVVFFLSKDFITSKWPMDELLISLERYQKNPGSFSLLPVFYELTVEDCSKVCGEWKEAIERLCDFTGARPDSVRVTLLFGSVLINPVCILTLVYHCAVWRISWRYG